MCGIGQWTAKNFEVVREESSVRHESAATLKLYPSPKFLSCFIKVKYIFSGFKK